MLQMTDFLNISDSTLAELTYYVPLNLGQVLPLEAEQRGIKSIGHEVVLGHDLRIIVLRCLQDAVETEEGQDLWKPIILELNRRGQHQFVIEDKLVHNVDIDRFRVDVMYFIEDQEIYF